MSERLNLTIDIFDAKAQAAQALPDLTEQGLINAVLQEFCEDFDFLGVDPTAYRLLRSEDRSALDSETPIGQQLRNKDHLILEPHEVTLPPEAVACTKQVYLRDQVGDNVFPLSWIPAIIGRPDQSNPLSALLAVNLEGYATGLRVSRRQARVVEEMGQFYVEGMANNPTFLLKDGAVDPIDVTTERQPIEHGDVIKLSRSGIDLRFIVRSDSVELP